MDPLKKIFSRHDRASTSSSSGSRPVTSNKASAQQFSSAYSSVTAGKAPEFGDKPVRGNGPSTFNNTSHSSTVTSPPLLPHPIISSPGDASQCTSRHSSHTSDFILTYIIASFANGLGAYSTANHTDHRSSTAPSASLHNKSHVSNASVGSAHLPIAEQVPYTRDIELSSCRTDQSS